MEPQQNDSCKLVILLQVARDEENRAVIINCLFFIQIIKVLYVKAIYFSAEQTRTILFYFYVYIKIMQLVQQCFPLKRTHLIELANPIIFLVNI